MINWGDIVHQEYTVPVDDVKDTTVKKVKYNDDLSIAYVGLPKAIEGDSLRINNKRRLYFSPFIGVAAIYGCALNRYIGKTPMTSIDAIIFHDLNSGACDLSTGCVDETHVTIVGPTVKPMKKITSTEYIYMIDMSEYKDHIYQDSMLQSKDVYMLRGISNVPVMKDKNGDNVVFKHKTTRYVHYITPEEDKMYTKNNMSFFEEFYDFTDNYLASVYEQYQEYTVSVNDRDDVIQEVDRTNAVYTRGGNIEKIDDFKYDKVYFGSPYKLSNPMKLDGPLFVSPFPGIASIFSVRPQKDVMKNKYGIPVEKVTNRGYDEWDRNKIDELKKGPIKELHVHLKGITDMEPIEDTVHGYLGEITITDELKEHIYQSARMNKVFEYCIDHIDSVSFSDIKEVEIKMYITGETPHKTVGEAFSLDDVEDDFFVESVFSYDKTMEACQELHKEWSKFGYGVPINGKLTNVPSSEYFCKNYRFLSPEDFEKYKGGVCWDFVEWGAKFLRRKGVAFHQYYIQTDTPPNYDTHTFIVCQCGDKFIYPESAFGIIEKDINGVGTFDSLPEIFNYITSKMFECNNNKSRFTEFKFSVQEYTQTPNYGCTCEEYMNFMKEHARLIFEGVAYPIDNVQEHYASSSNKFVDYLHWKAEQYIQDNFDIIQEATKATKTRRMKKKILRDLKADKDGYGTISDDRGNETDVHIRFGTNDTTHTGREWDPDKGIIDTIYINNNDMRRDNGVPVYHHEKNHISIDRRCGKRAVSKTNKMEYAYSGYTKVYEDKQDVDDLKLIKMFIEKHRDELISEHSRDVDEYLADLNAARSIGYKRMIKMLDDIRTDTNKRLSLSAKYHKGSIKKQAMNETINGDKALYDKYLSILNEMKEYHVKLKNSNAAKDTIKESEQMIDECEKILKSQSTFDKYLQNKHKNDPLFVSRYNQLIDEYNNDLKYRILFLREMEKYDKTKSKKKPEKVVTESHCTNDPLDQLRARMSDKSINDSCIYEHNVIFDYLNGFLDKSIYTESDIHKMTDDILAYTVLDDLESDVIDDIYREADIYSVEDNDIKTYIEFKEDILNYLYDEDDYGDLIQDSGRIERLNDDGMAIPEKCKCGGNICVFLQGEPVWLCKDCHKYYGTVPCNIQEAKLTTTKRDKLKDSEFGIPEKRTFPLNDKNHVEAAVRMFPHADASDKEALAKRILRKAHEFGMDTSGWDSINKYVVQEGMFNNIELVEIPYVTASSGYKPTVADESQINPFALFDKIPINDYTVNRYKSRTDDMAIGLKHLRVNDNVRGFIWLNQQDDVVGYVAVEKQDIGPFIIALELSPKYQGKGLGKALLEFAENYLGGRYLSVSKKNTHAFEMYKKCGWVVYDETPHMYFMKKDDNIVQPVVQEGAWQDIKNGVNPKSKKLFFHVSMDTKMNGKTLKPRIPTYLTKKGSVSDTYKEDSTIPRVCFSPSIEGSLNAIISAQKNLRIVGEKMFVYIPEKPISEYKIKTNKEIIKEKLVFDANATGEIWILEPVKLKLYGVIIVDQVKNIRDKPTVNGDPHCRCDYKWHWAVTPKYVDRTLEYQETYDEDSSKKKKTTKE